MGTLQEGSLAEGDSLVEEDILGSHLEQVGSLELAVVDIEVQHHRGSLVRPGNQRAGDMLVEEDRQGHLDNLEVDINQDRGPEGKLDLAKVGELELRTVEEGKQ